MADPTIMNHKRALQVFWPQDIRDKLGALRLSVSADWYANTSDPRAPGWRAGWLAALHAMGVACGVEEGEDAIDIAWTQKGPKRIEEVGG